MKALHTLFLCCCLVGCDGQAEEVSALSTEVLINQAQPPSPPRTSPQFEELLDKRVNHNKPIYPSPLVEELIKRAEQQWDVPAAAALDDKLRFGTWIKTYMKARQPTPFEAERDRLDNVEKVDFEKKQADRHVFDTMYQLAMNGNARALLYFRPFAWKYKGGDLKEYLIEVQKKLIALNYPEIYSDIAEYSQLYDDRQPVLFDILNRCIDSKAYYAPVCGIRMAMQYGADENPYYDVNKANRYLEKVASTYVPASETDHRYFHTCSSVVFARSVLGAKYYFGAEYSRTTYHERYFPNNFKKSHPEALKWLLLLNENKYCGVADNPLRVALQCDYIQMIQNLEKTLTAKEQQRAREEAEKIIGHKLENYEQRGQLNFIDMKSGYYEGFSCSSRPVEPVARE